MVGGVSGVLTVVTAVARLAKSLNEVRDRYNNVALNTTLVASQLNSIRAALEAIADWRTTTQDSSRPSQQLDEDLAVSLNCCAILITVIDSKLGEAGYTPGMKQKIRHLWLEDTLKEYLSNLEGQVRALQLLLTIFQWYAFRSAVICQHKRCRMVHRNQVLLGVHEISRFREMAMVNGRAICSQPTCDFVDAESRYIFVGRNR